MHTYSTIPVQLQAAGIWVRGNQFIPQEPLANVVFCLGNEHHTGNGWVQELVEGLLKNRFAVLCTDLLTADEDRLYSNQFSIQLNAERLTILSGWALRQKETAGLSLLYFSFQFGSPAALLAAAGNKAVAGLVSFSGRPGQILDKLQHVMQPVLLVYGKEDSLGNSLSHESCAAIGGIAEVQSVSGNGQSLTALPDGLLPATLQWFNACIQALPKNNSLARYGNLQQVD